MSISRCPHCGTANRAGSNFCNGCGTDLRNPDARPEPPPAPEPPAEPPVQAQPEKPARTRRPRPARPATPEPEPPPADPPLAGQPWLRLEFDAGDEPEAESSGDEGPPGEDEPRLITGVQGLLAPIRVATNIGDDDLALPSTAPLPSTTDLSAEQIRLIRTLMAEEPAPAPPLGAAPGRAGLSVGWVSALLALAVALPALLTLGGPRGEPMEWPGVAEAFNTVQTLTPENLVVVYWGYDPATAGEIDLAMQPVMRHLVERRVRLAVISTLPGGPAGARRLIAQVRTGVERPSALELAAESNWPATYTYLPGGAAVLPLVARDPEAALLDDPSAVTESTRNAVTRAPNLVVVAAAHAEDAQEWLEQVQPLERTPVIAVTGAGADPILRPYLDSGQLRGLVSGFDGGYSYQHLLEPFTPHTSPRRLALQVILQNWGHMALIVVIVLGNLTALLGRGGNE